MDGRQLKTMFVTVGTTKFDDLVKAVSSEEFIKMIISKGYNKIVIQTGLGTYTPTLANDEQLQSEVYQFKESLQGDMEEASLIISHGGEFNCPENCPILVVPHQLGAGTILEALTLNKPLVVVINNHLANNHQTELASQLQSDQHLVATNCPYLLEMVKNLDTSNLLPYQPGNPQLFGQFLNKTMGFRTEHNVK